ncbi:MAG: hypothetical protein WD926_01145 [Patescibacteria group bacterium]
MSKDVTNKQSNPILGWLELALSVMNGILLYIFVTKLSLPFLFEALIFVGALLASALVGVTAFSFVRKALERRRDAAAQQ